MLDISERPRKAHETISDWARDAARVITIPVASLLAHLGIHPNTVTLLGCVLSVGIAVLLAAGYISLGGWLLVVVAPLDAIDGALARLIGKESQFGPFLDSTFDRISDMALMIGVGIYYLQQGAFIQVILVFLALAGGTLVSYVRARADAVGFSCKVGLLTRLERLVVLVVGLITEQVTIALWVLAVGSILTALQRIIHVYRLSLQNEP